MLQLERRESQGGYWLQATPTDKNYSLLSVTEEEQFWHDRLRQADIQGIRELIRKKPTEGMQNTTTRGKCQSIGQAESEIAYVQQAQGEIYW